MAPRPGDLVGFDIMKQALLFSFVLIFPPLLMAAGHDSESQARVEIRKVDQGTSVKRVFSRLWARLRAYVPKPGTRQAATQRTQIAGVRGAESTASRLQPYWKGDRSEDPAYVREIETFHAAIELGDAGRLREAAAAFDAFVTTYPNSALNPHAQFALGLVYVELGKKQRGISVLQSFTRTYPSHLLAADARGVIQQLQAS